MLLWIALACGKPADTAPPVNDTAPVDTVDSGWSPPTDTDTDADTDTDTELDTDTDTDTAPPDLLLWLTAATAGVGEDTPVASWPDQSSYGHDLIQDNPDQQPTRRTDLGTAAPVIEFDGADDLLTGPALLGDGDVALTVVLAASVRSGGEPNDVLWAFGDLAIPGGGASLENTDSMLYFATGWGEDARPANGTYGSWYDRLTVVSIAKEPGSIIDTTRIRYGGSAVAATGSGAANVHVAAPFNLGGWGTQFGGLSVAELKVFNRALSDAELLAEECAMAATYGLSLAGGVTCP